MMETDPVFKMMCLKKFETMDRVQNNSLIFCNTPLLETLRPMHVLVQVFWL